MGLILVSVRLFFVSFWFLIVVGFAHAEQTIIIEQSDLSELPPLASFKDCDVCPEMIVIPLGSFMMGAIPGESRNGNPPRK